MKRFCLGAAFASFSLVLSAAAQNAVERPWQQLNMPAVAEVAKAWLAPPAEYGPEPYYGMNGPMSLAVVRSDLDRMKSLGFQAVTVQYGTNFGDAYLSPEYFAFFREFVLEAKKRDMRVWIVDDAGYPSGFAGGRFTSEHPELRMQALTLANKTVVASGSAFEQSVSPETVSVTALGPNGQVAQIPFDGGHARWTAPVGTWTVYVVQHAFLTSPTRSDTNPKRVKDGSQSLEDYLDPAATAQYITYTHDAYKKAVGDEFGKTILGFRGDEPDYSIAGLPWTPKFFAQFQAGKGYDIRPHLAAFLQDRDVPLTQEQLRARANYYDVFAAMFRDGFFKPLADWCAFNGLEYQVHLNHEEAQVQLTRSEGDFFRDMRFVQVPGIDSIWHQIWTDTISDFPRLASSVAHVYGHPRAFTESFAAYRPVPDITTARYILNEQFVRGINLVETMYFPASSTPGRGGPSGFMRDPAYPDLMQYTRRLSYLMSQGHPAAEVALLLPAASLRMRDNRADEAFVTAERVLSEHQIDFDIVDEDAIGSLLRTVPGAFLSRSGNRYRTVLVPRASLLPASVVDRLKQFAQGGGHVVFLGGPPAFVDSGSGLRVAQTTPAAFTWATSVGFDLPPTPTPPAQPPSTPPEPLDVPQVLLTALHTNTPPSALSLATPSTAARFTHRTLKDGDVFLLFNESSQPMQNEVTLRAAGRRVEIWDPQTGKTTPATGVHLSRGALTLHSDLPPYATQVLVVR